MSGVSFGHSVDGARSMRAASKSPFVMELDQCATPVTSAIDANRKFSRNFSFDAFRRKINSVDGARSMSLLCFACLVDGAQSMRAASKSPFVMELDQCASPVTAAIDANRKFSRNFSFDVFLRKVNSGDGARSMSFLCFACPVDGARSMRAASKSPFVMELDQCASPVTSAIDANRKFSRNFSFGAFRRNVHSCDGAQSMTDALKSTLVMELNQCVMPVKVHLSMQFKRSHETFLPQIQHNSHNSSYKK